jgi:uncharacterized OB-fold protein
VTATSEGPTADGPPADEPLVEHHILEYPGGYTRSLGPALGAFFTGLRDGRLVGARTAGGRVVVPPAEHDPHTAAPLGEWVEVGPAGTVTAWTWVARPKPGKHHLTRPFGFALVCPDGADTALVGVVDAGTPEAMSVGMRVAPRWARARSGTIHDLEAWVPLGDGAAPAPAPPNEAPEADEEPVTRIVCPIRLEYEINAGIAPSRYLRGLAQRRIIGQRARDSEHVYVPPRGSDPMTGAPTEVEVEVGQTGTVTTFCITNIAGLSELAPPIPYVTAQVLLDGAATPWFGLVTGCDPTEVRMGMRVRAVWSEQAAPDARTLVGFEPTGEPDAPYEDWKDYA